MGRRARGLTSWHGHPSQNGYNRPLPVCCTAPAAFAFPHHHWYSPPGLAEMPVTQAKEADLNFHVLWVMAIRRLSVSIYLGMCLIVQGKVREPLQVWSQRENLLCYLL